MNSHGSYQTWGITSFTGSLRTFSGEPNTEGPALCFTIRGDPDELLGESGGVLPAENMEGMEFDEAAFGLEHVPETFKGTPALALLSKDFTCTAKIDILNKMTLMQIKGN